MMSFSCDETSPRSVRQADADRVTRYYEEMQRFYGRFWNRRRVRYGLWFDDVRTHEDSLVRSDEMTRELLAIEPGERVLDAGCGVGATVDYLSRKAGADAVGISLSPDQLRRARVFVSEGRKTPSAKLMRADYMDLPFREESFEAVVGIESVCYAREKKEFLSEAYRVLKPGGRLVVLDGFRGRDPETPREQRSWDRFLSGLALTQLDSPAEFKVKLVTVGFEAIRSDDLTKRVLPSARRISRLSWLGAIPAYFPVRLGLLPRMWLDHALAGIDNQILFARGIEEYVAFSARKPVGSSESSPRFETK